MTSPVGLLTTASWSRTMAGDPNSSQSQGNHVLGHRFFKKMLTAAGMGSGRQQCALRTRGKMQAMHTVAILVALPALIGGLLLMAAIAVLAPPDTALERCLVLRVEPCWKVVAREADLKRIQQVTATRVEQLSFIPMVITLQEAPVMQATWVAQALTRLVAVGTMGEMGLEVVEDTVRAWPVEQTG